MSNESELDLDLLLDEDDELNSSHGTHDDLDEKERPASSHDDDDSFFSDDDDDDDVKPKAKPEAKSDPAADDDEEEEEEEIIKPALNPAIVGLGALAVAVLAGGAGYVMLNKNNNDQNIDSPTVTTSMPAPSFEELGKDLSIPSTNLVDEDAEKPIDAGSALAQTKVPVEAQPSFKAAVEPSVSTPAVAEKIDIPATSEVAHDVALADQGVNGVPALTAPVLAVSSPTPTPAVIAADDNVSKQELKQMVADAVKDVVSANQSEELKVEVASLKKELDEAKAHPTSDVALSEYKAKVIGEIRQNREKKELAKAEATKQLVEKAIEGKKRLPGFQVVNATVDGQISIIKAPSGRTFALFKGEKFKATNGSLLEVKEIVAEGKLVVAGDNWFIDDVVEKVQKIDPPKAAPAGNSATQKPVSSKKRESSAPVEKSTSISGWSFHASFEGGGYLVKTPSGEYKTIKKGENESGLGVIYGVDDNGNLKTEKGVIKGDM